MVIATQVVQNPAYRTSDFVFEKSRPALTGRLFLTQCSHTRAFVAVLVIRTAAKTTIFLQN
jgi:hypothetical protein